MLVSPLPADHAALIIEGAGDRKVFAPLCCSPTQVVIAGGKTLVREAHAAMQRDDRGRFVFVVDCDQDVARGDLRGAQDLIISEKADLEGDLLALGSLEPAVVQLVPAVG